MIFSPTDHSPQISISGAVATRSSTAGGAWNCARSDTSQSSGQRTIKFDILQVGSGGCMVGLCNGVVPPNTYVGNDNNGVSYWSGGNTYKGGAFTNIFPPGGAAFTTGDSVTMLVDLNAHTVEFKKNGGAYSLPIDITSLGANVFAAVTLGDSATFSSVQFDLSSVWDDTQAVNIVGAGDSMSLTGGVQEIHTFRLADMIRAAGMPVAQVIRAGINGASWNYAWPGSGYALTLIQDASVRVDPFLCNGLLSWLHVMAGTNGIVLAGNSAAAEYAALQTYARARVAAGWNPQRIIVYTMLPRTGMSETTRSAYNALIVGDSGAIGYQVARLDLDPNIGQAGDNLNLTYFQADGTHPTDAGQAIMAQIGYAVQYAPIPPVPPVPRQYTLAQINSAILALP